MVKDFNVQEQEISLRELFVKISGILRYIKSYWLYLFIFSILGLGIGLVYALISPVNYVCKLTFVLEESRGSGGGLTSLAGQFGFDFGGASGGSVFSGDNILLFLESESLVRETLLTADYDNSKQTLADRYSIAYGLKNDWAKDDDVGDVSFSNRNNSAFSRKEDSLLQGIIQVIIDKRLDVVKPDKKASFIEVKTSMRDEKLSMLFTERLVKIATQRYVDSKTKVKAANVDVLQRRADSLGALLNNRTYAAASSQQNLVDVNPALRLAPISSEISSREKAMTATLYTEVVKNLELSKTILNQATPAIELVDYSTFPLEKQKVSLVKSSLGGGLLCAFLTLFYLLISLWIKVNIKPDYTKNTYDFQS